MTLRSSVAAWGFALALVTAAPVGLAFESDFSNLARTGLVTIETGETDLVLEVFSQLGASLGAENIEAIASGGGQLLTLPVTHVDTATTPTGSTSYFTLDASALCNSPGTSFIVTARLVFIENLLAVNSKILVCTG